MVRQVFKQPRTLLAPAGAERAEIPSMGTLIANISDFIKKKSLLEKVALCTCRNFARRVVRARLDPWRLSARPQDGSGKQPGNESPPAYVIPASGNPGKDRGGGDRPQDGVGAKCLDPNAVCSTGDHLPTFAVDRDMAWGGHADTARRR